MTSPSGDARSSAIARMVSEHPAPAVSPSAVASSADIFDENEENSVPTPPQLIKTQSCGLVGLKRKALSQSSSGQGMNIMKRSKFSSQSSSSSSAGPQEKFYDGLGGHSKPDVFPVPNRRPVMTVKKAAIKPNKPKAKAPKDSGVVKNKTLDKFFNFDTSISLRGVPSGLDVSQVIRPVKPVASAIISATSRIETSSPVPTLMWDNIGCVSAS